MSFQHLLGRGGNLDGDSNDKPDLSLILSRPSISGRELSLSTECLPPLSLTMAHHSDESQSLVALAQPGHSHLSLKSRLSIRSRRSHVRKWIIQKFLGGKEGVTAKIRKIRHRKGKGVKRVPRAKKQGRIFFWEESYCRSMRDEVSRRSWLGAREGGSRSVREYGR